MLISIIALDHTRILGPTREDICEKKAGIFKRGKPCLIGPDVPLEPATVSAIFMSK